MINKIKRSSLSIKIFLGFFFVFVVFAMISTIFFINLQEEREKVEQITTLTQNSAKTLDINRGIAEIQKLISVYSVTGSDSIIEKTKNYFGELSSDLKNVKKTTKDKELLALISSLEKVITEYGGNIESLKERYSYRKRISQEVLPSLDEEIKTLFFSEIEKYEKRRDFKRMSFFQKSLISWKGASALGQKFLDKRDYKSKQEMKKRLKRLEQDIKISSYNSFYKNFITLKRRYETVYEQAVQANRIYLSLTNVVMAGSAVEFTNLSNTLREKSLEQLDVLIKDSDHLYERNKSIMIFSFLFSVPLILFIAMYFNLRVARSIKSLAATFRGFIQGNLDLDIAGLDRNDEIGQLAKAASAFRDVSREAQEDKKRATELAEGKSKFLATMSHEIRTPMNAVLACTNLLIDDVKNKEHLDLLKTIQTSGDALLILINDILDYSKLESGKINLESESFNVKECILSVKELLSFSAEKKGVSLNVTLDEDFPDWIVGDITRLRQVFVNLVGNGIKFTNTNVHLYAYSKRLDNDELELEFSIEDDGIGIDQEGINQLFKEFGQVDASTTRKYGGTGLGLAICKGIVDAIDGEIWVESEKGKGAKFKFKFTTSIGEEALSVKKQVNNQELLKSNYDLKILLAEDNKVNQVVAVKMIEKIGFKVDVVENGLEAIEAIRKNKYELIFMDQHMPELDGVDATKKIRSFSDIRQPRIYALTASAFKEDRDRCIGVGMDGFLTKPIVREKLQEAMIETLYCIENNWSLTDKGQSSQSSQSSLNNESLFNQNILNFISNIPFYKDQVYKSMEEKDLEGLRSHFSDISKSVSLLNVMHRSRILKLLAELSEQENFAIIEPKLETLFNLIEELILELKEKVSNYVA